MLCQDCSKRPTCKKQCKALEKDLKKQEKYQREINIYHEETLDFLVNDPLVFPYDYAEMGGFFSSPDPLHFPFLTPLQNKCLHLFYFEGKSYKEIAISLSGNRSKTQLSQTQVRRQLHSAKRLIREHFSYM